MPQYPAGFEPDEQDTDLSGFTPDEASPQNTSMPPASKSFMQSIADYVPKSVKDVYNYTSQPLVDFPSRAGKAISDYFDPTSYATGDPRRYLSAYPEALGQTISGLSSPQNLALTVATGGAGAAARYGATGTARGLRMVGGALSAPVAAHGAYQVSEGETIPEKLMGGLELGMGAMGVRDALPVRRSARPNISPEPQPSMVDLTNQHLTEARQKADLIVKSGPEPLLTPEEIPAIRARYDELRDKGTSGKLTKKELLEGQALDKRLREVNFGETGSPKPEAITPEVVPSGEQVGEVLSDGTLRNPESTRWEAQAAARRAKEVAEQPGDIIDVGEQLPSEAAALEQQISPEMQQSFNVENLQGLERSPNASGESAASAEAISRQAGMRNRGEKYVVYDRAGNKRDLIGPEAHDYQPVKGETYGLETPRGFIKKIDNGGKVTSNMIGKRKTEYPGFQGNEEVPQIANDLRTRLDEASKPRQAAEFGPKDVAEVSKVVDEANVLPDGPEKQGVIRQALGANKAILTSWDLSAPGRQGKSFILNKSWWTSLDDMVKAWGSKEAAHLIDQSIVDHPSGYFKPGENGKSFADKIGLDIAPHEEMFNTTVGRAVGKLGLVERSSRAHTAFLNKLRSDQFVSFMDSAKKNGVDVDKNLMLPKAYAKFINDATGRGSLNFGKWKLEKNVNVLNDIFFAPRNMSGQIRTWNAVLNLYKYYQADPVLRKQALKSLFAIAGTGLAVGEMAKMVSGVSVSNDPTSADYRKIKIGNTRIDPFGGYQQFPVAAMKLLSGDSTSTITGKTTDLTAGKFGQQTRQSIAERFFVNRLAPLPSFVWAWMNNREFDGKPFEVKKALYERTMPIAMKDIYELAQEDPVLAAIMAAPTALGLTGTQTYTGR